MKLSVECLDSVRIQTSDDIESAAQALFAAVNAAVDARIGASHNIARRRPLVNAEGEILATKVFGWADGSDSWWRLPLYALGSPLPTACRYESEPFWCNTHGAFGRRPNPFLDHLDLSNFEQRALVHAAIVAPVHLPFGQIGAVSIVPRSVEQTDLAELFAEHGAMFGLFARTFIAGYVAVTGDEHNLPHEPQLRKREIECLQWVASGKSDDVIAELMGITTRTVRFHITNAMMKLMAANRSQATIKAAQLGYLKIR